nr:unnamed protein product [Callosobruchus chinensis]
MTHPRDVVYHSTTRAVMVTKTTLRQRMHVKRIVRLKLVSIHFARNKFIPFITTNRILCTVAIVKAIRCIQISAQNDHITTIPLLQFDAVLSLLSMLMLYLAFLRQQDHQTSSSCSVIHHEFWNFW